MRNALILFVAIASAPALAQDSDKDYLTAFLEESLSDAGREVTITGFDGALSSRASIERLTIADAKGPWLTLEGVVLDWSQSSLLSGELVVNELSATHLSITRMPDLGESTLPSAEAKGFSLPQLPVSIAIGKIAIDAIDLDARLLGQPVEGRLDAALTLADGSGQAQLDLTRSGDGPSGAIALDASYDNSSGMLELDLAAGEGANGLVAVALKLPGQPATDFRLTGSGPIQDFAAEVALATDGTDRLAGNIVLSGLADGGLRLTANISGNLAPLFLPDYAKFLGDRLELLLGARLAPSGAVLVDTFALKAGSLQAQGQAAFASDGLPESLSLTGTLASPDGTPMLLPLGGAPTRIDKADFNLTTVRDGSLDWTVSALVQGLDRPDLAATDLMLDGSGRIARTSAGDSFGGTLDFAAHGLAPSEPSLAKAIGTSLEGGFKFHFLEGGDAIRFSDIRLIGRDLSGQGQIRLHGLGAAFMTSGWISLTTSDLSRFDDLAKVPLAGSGSIRLEGSGSQLSGYLDAVADVSAQGLRIGISQIDRLLSGPATAHVSILRDESGTTIRDFLVATEALEASLSGKLSSSGSDLSGTAAISTLSAVDPAYSGSATLDLSLNGTPETATIDLTGSTDALALGEATADRLLSGKGIVSASLGLSDGKVALDSLQIVTDQVDLALIGTVEGGQTNLAVTGKLADVGVLIPDLVGPLTISGTLTDDGSAFGVALSGRGPGKIDAKIGGTMARDFASADLSISGTGQAGLANIFIAPRLVEGPSRFDLQLSGPLQLSSLSGRLSLTDGRLSDPGLGFALEGINARADLGSGKADVTLTAGLSTGGSLRLAGPISLAAPFSATLSLDLERVRFFDPKLYETVLGGSLSIKGPLSGGALISGALTLSETELRVPESGIDASGILLEMTHLSEPAEVRATRVRAGLIDVTGGRAGATSTDPYRLDLTLSAPSRIFLRGRGIDAELGGELRLAGTTQSVIPAGEFSLIRGRLDILGKRLVLDQADLKLEGSFVPQLTVSASTESDGIQSVVLIEGPADDPNVTFSSAPDLPQEEVLARLLFGRGLQNISALQAAQLAQAVATLAGRGGEGMIGKLRKSFGLDDLDIATSEDGATALKAGKYIAENIYTEVEIDQNGTSKINLNLDLRPGVTVKGQVGADGDTGIGIYIERDY